MELSVFASTILYADRWQEKLVPSAEGFSDLHPGAPLTAIPHFPGRPRNLTRIGRSDFPKVETLGEDLARGRLLHFFANHELLAMELMALTLLKFPRAEASFRLGLARTIVEEQKHLSLYVARMRELGVDFGDLPVTDYFWNTLKDGRSPLEFVVQMSMTLEQANLDFSLYYQKAVEAVGDAPTAALLQTVYQEEIGHVKHGVMWFNRWRGADQSQEDDWDAYNRLLLPPLNPQRAKGPVFCAAARREAGLSERYITEMEVYSGSKGRPPSYWHYNPLCEAEIVRGKPGFTGTQTVRELGLDLACVPAFLALQTDVVLVEEMPRVGWLKSLQDAGFVLPEFRKLRREGENFPERHLAGFEPWGWSPDAFERFKPAAARLHRVESGNGVWARGLLEKSDFGQTKLGALFSKTWSLDFYRRWIEAHPEDRAVFGPGVALAATLGETFTEWVAARDYLARKLAAGETVLAKAPWGTSGTMNKRILKAEEIDSNLGKWIQNTIELQGAVVLEPWLDKVADLSMQIEVGEKCRVVGARQFINGGRLEYRGTLLGPKFRGLDAEHLRFLYAESAHGSPLSRWQALGEAIGEELRAQGYQGNVGVDALLARREGRVFLRPVVEVNPRWTMGRVAMELEKQVLPGAPAAWLFLDASSEKFRALGARHPVQLQTKSSRRWIAEGMVSTNDPQTARQVLTTLVVGHAALKDLMAVDELPSGARHFFENLGGADA